MEKWKSEVRLSDKGYEKKWEMEKLLCVCRQKIFTYPLVNFLRLLFYYTFTLKLFYNC
jgi:hypothetical protein